VQTQDSVKKSGIVLDDKRFSRISPNPEKVHSMSKCSCFVEKNRTPYIQ